VDPPGQSRGWDRWVGSGLRVFEVRAVEPSEIGRQAQRRPITWQFCFGAVPYTVQRHDCRGIIAVTAADVRVIGRRTTKAPVATRMLGREPGFFCARRQTAGPRCLSAAIAIGATSTAPTVRSMRVGGRCIGRGDAIRRAVADGTNMRSGRAGTRARKNKVTHHGSPSDRSDAMGAAVGCNRR
jgi:hypothetical protein